MAVPIETKELISLIDSTTDYILCQDVLWLIKEFTISEYTQRYLFLTNEDNLFSIPLSIIDFDKKEIFDRGLYDNLVTCECHCMPFKLDKILANDLNNNCLVMDKYVILIKCISCPQHQVYSIKNTNITYDGSIKIIIYMAWYGFKVIIY